MTIRTIPLAKNEREGVRGKLNKKPAKNADFKPLI